MSQNVVESAKINSTCSVSGPRAGVGPGDSRAGPGEHQVRPGDPRPVRPVPCTLPPEIHATRETAVFPNFALREL